jgi:uncharacterized protein (DUF433 family)
VVALEENRETMDNLLSHITINPAVCHGKPTIRNKRYPVEMILDLLAAGSTHQEILEDYPSLENDDILACRYYQRFRFSR